MKMLDSWDEQYDGITARLMDMNYDNEKVLKYELEMWDIFKRRTDLWTDFYPQQNGHVDMLNYCFGDSLGGTGVLDVGTGKAGVFCAGHLTNRFKDPRICTDAFECNCPIEWSYKVMEASGVLATFGENAFDYVQMIETAEHIDPEYHRSAIEQLIKVSRRYVLITSMGLSHHCGEGNAALCRVNPFMAYKGQPNPEMLIDLGMKVIIPSGYQVIAWLDKGK